TATALNRARLAVELGRGVIRRTRTLDDSDLLQLTGRLQAFLADGGSSVRARLAASAVPSGLLSAAYMRIARPGTPLARDWSVRTASTARLTQRHTSVTFAATGSDEPSAALGFAQVAVPNGAQTADPTLEPVASPRIVVDDARQAEIGARMRVGTMPRPAGTLHPTSPETVPRPTVRTRLDVSGLATSVRSVLDPAASVRASLLMRIPALEGVMGDAGIPGSLALGLVFTDPLYWDLAALGPQWVLPGAGALGRNRVRLLETNTTFVGAFLIGANHEIARELLWRGYPIDLTATFFLRFWDSVDPEHRDIIPLAEWKGRQSIDRNMAATSPTSTVIVVRGDLIRRYPTAGYYLQAASFDGGEANPIDGTELAPSFLGALDRQTVFFGFDIDPKVVRSDPAAGQDGHFVVIEEQAAAPRFGLDPAGPRFGGKPRSWNDLRWSHLVESQIELDALTHATAGDGNLHGVTIGGTTWGYNAAHMARATWQRPYRMLIHADLLI
ncbi:MAG: hypothetical protein L0206_10920, partial [Actinobacteria bacterium]|nr:hypothetical protein [Actinomycetota bacterium]